MLPDALSPVIHDDSESHRAASLVVNARNGRIEFHELAYLSDHVESGN